MYLTRLTKVRRILPGFLPGIVDERDGDTVFKVWLLDDTTPLDSGSWTPLQDFLRHRQGREWLHQTTGHLIDVYLLDPYLGSHGTELGELDEGGPFEHFLDIRGDKLPFASAVHELASELGVSRVDLPALAGFVSSRHRQVCTLPFADCPSLMATKQRLALLVERLERAAQAVLGNRRVKEIMRGTCKADLAGSEADQIVRHLSMAEGLTWRDLDRRVQGVVEDLSSHLQAGSGSRRCPRGEPPPVDLEWRIESKSSRSGLELEHRLSFPSGRIDHADFASRSQPAAAEDVQSLAAQAYTALEAAIRDLDQQGEPLWGPEIWRAVEDVGENLSDRLLPDNVRDLLSRKIKSIDSLLIVSDETAIPWEIVRVGAPGEIDFLCLQTSLGRWLSTAPVPSDPVLGVRKLTGFAVVGDSTPPKLPAAAREAEALRQRLQRIPQLAGSVAEDPEAGAFLENLESDPPDLLHFVGHGDFDDHNPDLSSLRFVDRNVSAQSLNSSRLSFFASRRPVIFLNACRSGRVGKALTGSGGWPDRWIRIGRCRALLCPQWAVKDRSAHEFSEGVYTRSEMAGATLGRVVLETRRALLARKTPHQKDPTALAYVLYGHPNATLLLGSRPGGLRGSTPRQPSSATESSLSPLGIPQFTWRPDRSPPGALLRAEYGVVEFHLREQELEELEDWSKVSQPIGICLMTGPGGFGKTRLAKELCLRMRERGWQAGFIDESSTAEEVWASMATDERPVMAVVDYAESRSELLIPLLKRLWGVERGTYRVILLARAALDWWEYLKTQPDGVGELVSSPATRRTFVRPLASSEEMRGWSYRLAFESFCAQLDLQPPATEAPDLQAETYERVLMIHMHSLAAAHGMESPGELGILDFALDRERRYWRRLLDARGLPRSLAPGIETAICLLTLTGGAQSEDETIDLVGRLSAFSGRPGDVVLQVVRLLHDAYPGHGRTAGRWLEPLMPDLLGEHLMFRLLGPDPRESSHEILRILMHGDPEENRGRPRGR